MQCQLNSMKYIYPNFGFVSSSTFNAALYKSFLTASDVKVAVLTGNSFNFPHQAWQETLGIAAGSDHIRRSTVSWGYKAMFITWFLKQISWLPFAAVECTSIPNLLQPSGEKERQVIEKSHNSRPDHINCFTCSQRAFVQLLSWLKPITLLTEPILMNCEGS